MTTTRVISNAGAALTRPDGTPLAFVQVSFLLSSLTGAPCDVFDAVTGDRVVGNVSVTTDANGLFSAALWPNDRGSVASQYVCTINYPGSGSFSAGVPSGSTPLTWLQFKTSGLPVTPQIVTALTAYIAQMDAQAAAALAQANIATAEATIATADVALTHADVISTHADVVLTHADVAATHSDVVLTHADAATTQGLTTVASTAATNATVTAAALNASLASFRSKWLGSFATDPLLDGNGNALSVGAEYFNIVSNVIRIYTAAGWENPDAAALLDMTNAALSAIAAAGSSSTASSYSQTAGMAAAAALAAQLAAQNFSGSSQISATASASSAAQAVIAQTLAQAAWAASTAPTEQIAAVNKAFFTNNVIVAAIIYDTRKDSDGGAWRNRCMATSWYNETIYGVYRGECATEAACRAISGATTNDFFHNTTDGLFYALNVISGVTQIYRGNRRGFPEVVAITAESGRVIIWDLTDSSVPMWMVVPKTGWNPAPGWYQTDVTVSPAAINGKIFWGTYLSSMPTHLSGGACFLSFVNDKLGRYGYGIGWSGTSSGISRRVLASMNLEEVNSLPIIASTAVNSIAVTVLPNSPIDPATGLPVPTDLVATAGGGSWITDSGVVYNSAITTAIIAADINKNGMSLLATATTVYVYNTMPTASGKVADATFTTSSTPAINGTIKTVAWAGADILVGTSTGAFRIRYNPTTPAASIISQETNTWSSGLMNGDIRLAALSDTVVETVSGAELVTNGTFNTDVSGWTVSTGSSTWNATSSVRVTNDSTGVNYSSITQTITVVVGKTYRISFRIISPTVGGVHVGIPGNLTLYGVGLVSTKSFVAKNTSLVVTTTNGTNVANLYCDFDNISVIECAADRSVKANPLTVVGSLIKSAVNTESQLVAWSAFSATNFLEQAYSANLDFAGDFDIPVWIYPTASAQNGTVLSRTPLTALAGNSWELDLVAGVVALGRSIAGAAYADATFGYAPPINAWTLLELVKASGVFFLRVNGTKQATTIADTNSYVNATAVLDVGIDYLRSTPFLGSLALLRISATSSSDDQGTYRSDTERKMFEPNAKCTIDGTSTAVTTLAYDEVTDLLDVGTSWGRSTFKGLVRQSSEATTNGAAVAYAAYDGNRITVGATGAKLYIPSKYLRDELNRAAEQKKQFGQQLVKKYFIATAGQVTFVMGLNEVVSSVYQQGLLKDEAAGAGFYSLSFDGFRWSITLGAGAAAGDRVTVFYTRVLP